MLPGSVWFETGVRPGSCAGRTPVRTLLAGQRAERRSTNVDLKPKLTEADFAFQPPQTAQVQDGTQSLTNELDQHLAERAAKKKADANNASGALLDQSIPVPKVPADGSAPLAAPK